MTDLGYSGGWNRPARKKFGKTGARGQTYDRVVSLRLDEQTVKHFEHLADLQRMKRSHYLKLRLKQLRALDLALASLPAAGRMGLGEIVKEYVEGRKCKE